MKNLKNRIMDNKFSSELKLIFKWAQWLCGAWGDHPFDPIKHWSPLNVTQFHRFHTRLIWLDSWIEMQKNYMSWYFIKLLNLWATDHNGLKILHTSVSHLLDLLIRMSFSSFPTSFSPLYLTTELQRNGRWWKIDPGRIVRLGSIVAEHQTRQLWIRGPKSAKGRYPFLQMLEKNLQNLTWQFTIQWFWRMDLEAGSTIGAATAMQSYSWRRD